MTEHPFLDPRLIRYSLGIHARIDPLPRTAPKPILGAAMNGILPDEIRTRPKAGFFNEPYFRGVARYLAELEALIAGSPPEVDDWVDRRVLTECLRRSALGIGNLRIQMDRLNLTLSYLLWLGRHASWPPLSHDETETIPLEIAHDNFAAGARAGVSASRRDAAVRTAMAVD